MTKKMQNFMEYGFVIFFWVNGSVIYTLYFAFFNVHIEDFHDFTCYNQIFMIVVIRDIYIYFH